MKKTLLEIITVDWLAAGNRGPLTGEYIRQWHTLNPAYGAGMWQLSTGFYSGSTLPVRGRSHFERAMSAWIAAGNPSPSDPMHDAIAYGAFEYEYLDELDDEYYDREPAPEPPPKKASGRAKKPKR